MCPLKVDKAASLTPVGALLRLASKLGVDVEMRFGLLL